MNFDDGRRFLASTPRASLDDVCEEVLPRDIGENESYHRCQIVEDLFSPSSRTPPQIAGQRLLDSRNNIQRSSPFKSLVKAGKAPRTPPSPTEHTNVAKEWEDENTITAGNGSFTLRDIFLQAGEAGVQGETGAFNFDLLRAYFASVLCS